MTNWYILKDKKPVKVDDFMEYAMWSQDFTNKVVEQTDIGDIKVSTVFLGLDHSWTKGVVILFETMVFGGQMDSEQWRYSTWEEAEKGHKNACKLVLELFSIKPEELQKAIIESLN